MQLFVYISFMVKKEMHYSVLFFTYFYEPNSVTILYRVKVLSLVISIKLWCRRKYRIFLNFKPSDASIITLHIFWSFATHKTFCKTFVVENVKTGGVMKCYVSLEEIYVGYKTLEFMTYL